MIGSRLTRLEKAVAGIPIPPMTPAEADEWLASMLRELDKHRLDRNVSGKTPPNPESERLLRTLRDRLGVR
jgi:hypothetical protein